MHFHRATILATLIILLASCTSCSGFWDIPISSIAVTPPSPSLLTGVQQQFTASATYGDGTTGVLKTPVWTSSNAAVVFINANGIATAVATGSSTISASERGVSGSTTVMILTSPLTSIQVSPTDVSISASQGSQQFSATGTFNDGTSRDISSGVTWTSSNTSIATINTLGLANLTGNLGSTTITATSGNISGSTTLTVTR